MNFLVVAKKHESDSFDDSDNCDDKLIKENFSKDFAKSSNHNSHSYEKKQINKKEDLIGSKINIFSLKFQKCQTSENKNIPEIKKIFKRRNITKKNVLNLSADSKNSVDKKISPQKIPNKINESFWDDERKDDGNFTKKKNQSNISSQIKNIEFQKCQTSENNEIKKIFKRRSNITKINVLQFKNKKQIFSNLSLNLSADSKNSVDKKISPQKILNKINESFWDFKNARLLKIKIFLR